MLKPAFFRWCFCFSPLLDGQFLSLVDSRSYSTPSTNTAMPKTSKQINYSFKIFLQTSPSYLHTVERSVYLQTNISLVFQKKNSPWKPKMFVYDYKCAPPFIIDTVSRCFIWPWTLRKEHLWYDIRDCSSCSITCCFGHAVWLCYFQ